MAVDADTTDTVDVETSQADDVEAARCGALFLRSGLLQRRLTSSGDTPNFCQSSQACLVNLRCISTPVVEMQ
jgi:hypothetical protein